MFSASHLLIMEDDREVASLYCCVLQDRGHIVTLASTADQCLKMYSERLQSPDEKKNS